jgi:hypothetical protein
MRALPTANNITGPPTETILFGTNKIKFVPKFRLPITDVFSLYIELFNLPFYYALLKYGSVDEPSSDYGFS